MLKNCSRMYSSIFAQYTTHLQVITIYNSLVTTQRPAHNEQRNLKIKNH